MADWTKLIYSVIDRIRTESVDYNWNSSNVNNFCDAWCDALKNKNKNFEVQICEKQVKIRFNNLSAFVKICDVDIIRDFLGVNMTHNIFFDVRDFQQEKF